MSDNQNWGNMGEQMKEAVAQALRTGDFKNLNNLVNQTASNALNEVGKHIFSENNVNQPNHQQGAENSSRGPMADGQNAASPREQKISHAQKKREEQKRLKQQQSWQEQIQRRQAQFAQQKDQFLRQKNQLLHPNAPVRQGPEQGNAVSFVKFNKIGNVSNVLYKVFGGIGLGVTGILFFVRFILLFANFPTNAAGWIVNLIFMAVFFGMIQLGIGQGKRLKRARRYMQLCDRKMYIGTEALAQSTGKSKRYVLKDLQKMLRLGMFPEGHLDKQKTYFMLNDAVYKQYLETEENLRRRELEAQKNSGQITSRQKNTEQDQRPRSEPDKPDIKAQSSDEAELNAMIAEGTECIRKLRYLNDRIPGEIISAKLFRLENLLKEIFDNLKEHPEQMHRMHKLMEYYLPTTLKLVDAYADFDRVSTPGEEITAAKAEIENTLDTINQAFTELLNNLFQDAVLDATTDAQVLKTMLAREGLMNEMDIHKPNIDGGKSNEQ